MLLRGCSVVGIRSGPKSVLTVFIAERGKLVISPSIGKANRKAGRWYCGCKTPYQAGKRRLRVPSCNGEDTELSPARKGAEFWRVLYREKIKGTFLKEESQMTAIWLVHLLLLGKGL